MTSTTDGTRAPITVHVFARMVEGLHTAAREVADVLVADPALLAEVPDELLETLTLSLHSSADTTTAAATVVTGRLDRQVGSVRGKLIAGRYPSTSRFLAVEAGMSTPQARATVARGRDLDTHSTRVADAWMAGAVTGGAVRDLTLGVTDALRRSTRTDTPIARGEALDHLLPLAERGDTDRLHRAVGEMRLRIDPDGVTEDSLFAFENQSLSIVDAGSMWRISGWITAETAAAAKTVLGAGGRQIAEQQLAGIEHDADCDLLSDTGSGAVCSCGETDRARRKAGLRPDHLNALAFGEVMTHLMDDATLGSHHRVAPHLTVVVDTTDAAAPLSGRLAMPGTEDTALLGEQSLNRLLCDSDITRILTTVTVAPRTPTTPPAAAGAEAVAAAPSPRPPTEHDYGAAQDPGCDHVPEPGPAATRDTYLDAVITTLDAFARSVLYVGRTERTVTAAIRRALEIRDGHCVFPGCRATVARCHAHHVLPWQHGGATDLPNMALVCPSHHHAVHEGGWAMTLTPGMTGHEQGCWDFTPPLTRSRRLRP
jgi:hypothetical protein